MADVPAAIHNVGHAEAPERRYGSLVFYNVLYCIVVPLVVPAFVFALVREMSSAADDFSRSMRSDTQAAIPQAGRALPGFSPAEGDTAMGAAPNAAHNDHRPAGAGQRAQPADS